MTKIITASEDLNNMVSGKNYDKYVVGGPAILGEGRTDEPLGSQASKGRDFGQVKYAKRGGYISQYVDETRYTDNDKEAFSMSQEPLGKCNDGDENQGGMY